MSGSDVAISIRGLSKAYSIAHQGLRRPSFRDVVMDRLRHPLRKVPKETFWALKDVSFDVHKGDVVGIIGRNGAGKSTLLKILSRITKPTSGEIDVYGRVGSLLEVGTGFHPELTGRENIYLNGAILGMRRAEIRKQFDAIVDFAEVEKFLDTPVKRYSSGMYVRLAFAVAAHLNPEILIVDEVLSVGDAQFQKKCLGKMQDVSRREGRTVLFVSHNMTAVLSLCERGMLFESGKAIVDTVAEQAVVRYLGIVRDISAAPLATRKDRAGNGTLRFTWYSMQDANGKAIDTVACGRDVILAFRYEGGAKRLANVHVAVGIHGSHDENLTHLATNISGTDFSELPPQGVVVCRIPRLSLLPNKYGFNLYCTVNGEVADWVQNAGVIMVEPNDIFGTGRLPPSEQGAFLLQHSWSADAPLE